MKTRTRRALRNLMDFNDDNNLPAESGNNKPAKPSKPKNTEVFNLDVICGDLVFKGGVVKHYTTDELQQLINDIKAASNTRKYWAKKGANVKKARVYTNRGLLQQIADETGKTYTDVKEAAEKEGYYIVTLKVKMAQTKNGTWERIPVETDEHEFVVIDTDPAFTGIADDT